MSRTGVDYDIVDYDVSKCIICNKQTNEDLSHVTTGIQILISCCSYHGHKNLSDHLASSPECVLVHKNCRKKFIDVRSFKKQKTDEPSTLFVRKLWSEVDVFNWKTMRFFCGESTTVIEEWRRASTLELRDNVLKCCQQRVEKNSNDVWALAVQGRLEACHDLPAEEAIYHKNCHTGLC